MPDHHLRPSAAGRYALAHLIDILGLIFFVVGTGTALYARQFDLATLYVVLMVGLLAMIRADRHRRQPCKYKEPREP